MEKSNKSYTIKFNNFYLTIFLYEFIIEKYTHHSNPNLITLTN